MTERREPENNDQMREKLRNAVRIQREKQPNKHRINKWQNQAKKRAENVTAILISRWNGGEDVITVEELLNYSSR